MACDSAGKARKSFVVVFSLKCLLASGARASNSSTERQTLAGRTWPMTFDACTCDLTIAPFVECRIEAGLDDMKVDRRGLMAGARTLGGPHVFSAKNVVISQSVLLVDDLGISICSFAEDISLDLTVPLEVKLV